MRILRNALSIEKNTARDTHKRFRCITNNTMLSTQNGYKPETPLVTQYNAAICDRPPTSLVRVMVTGVGDKQVNIITIKAMRLRTISMLFQFAPSVIRH